MIPWKKGTDQSWAFCFCPWSFASKEFQGELGAGSLLTGNVNVGQQPPALNPDS